MKNILLRTWALICIMLCVFAAALAEIKLPASLQIIDQKAFYGDTSISKVIVPDGTTEIHSLAFANSSLA